MIYNLEKILKKNQYIVISFLIFLLFLILNCFNLHNKMIETNIYGKRYYFLLFTISTFTYFIVFFVNKYLLKKTTLEKIFVINSLILGFFFLLLSPMFTGSDEQNHYYRIYEIATGNLVTPVDKVVGSRLPTSLDESYNVAGYYNTTKKYRDITAMQKIRLNKNKIGQYGKDSRNYDNTALYSPIQYFPHAIGFVIGIAFNLSPMIIGILGRLFNLIFYTIIGYLCIKTIPKAKLFYLLILICPSMLQCATTLSADAFTNVMFLLLLAIVFNTIFKKEKLNEKKKFIICTLCLIISLCKIVYLPIVFILLFITKDSFNNIKEKNIFCFLVILCSCIVSYLWINYTNSIFNVAYPKAAVQKQFIFSHIIEYGFVFIRTMMNDFSKNIESLFVGTRMYHSQLLMPSFISFTYVIIVYLAFRLCNIKKENTTPVRICLILISILIMGLMSTAIYIQCTANQPFGIGKDIIFGIQGRYFIPVVFLIPFIISNRRKLHINSNLLIFSALLINIITYMYMIVQFSI